MNSMTSEPVDVAYAKKLEAWGLGAVPFKQQYLQALRQLLPSMNESARRMLFWHARAPNATATAEDIALASGQSGFRATNLIYGRLAADLRRVIGGQFANTRPGDMQLSIVVSVIPRDPPSYPYARLAMHDPLVVALQELQGS
jgi:hypothetical protein